jgi:peptidoglycan/xylan/chitin deacetylase (PgdA/CDA1 family)
MRPIALSTPYIKLQEFCSPKRQVLILYYHRVLPKIKWGDPLFLQVSLENFKQHIQFLACAYPIISLQDFAHQIRTGAIQRKRQIVITFDDGYRDNYLYAYPILKQWNVPVTIFPSTYYVETQSLFFWERLQYLIQRVDKNRVEWKIPKSNLSFAFLATPEQRHAALIHIHQELKKFQPQKIFEILNQMDKDNQYVHPGNIAEEDLPLTWEQIREMTKTTISVGAHTYTHPVLSTLSPAEAEQEILRSKQMLEEQLQQEVRLFAYPYGEENDFNEETVAILKRLNFLCACSTYFGANDLTCNLFSLKRVVVRNWDVLTLARKIAHVFKYNEWIV